MSEVHGAIPLYRYQRDWFLDRRRFKIGMFARQTGKTFTTTLEIADDCFAAEAEARRSPWVILSRGERQSKEAIGVFKQHSQAYGLVSSEIETDFDAGAVTYKALEVQFPHGSSIIALPANPDTARGFSRNVFLDEFAFHRDSREIWRALFPVISAGWRIRVTSTPNGKGNKFHELMTADDQLWSRHTVDIYRAVADGLPRDIAELRAALADEDAWAQEYELKWLDEASAWLTFELITACEDEDAGDPAKYQGGPCFAGNDIARRGDLWTLYVFELVGDVFIEREAVELRHATFAEHDAELDRVMRTYEVVRVAMDQTGMGEKPVEDARRRYGSKVEGVILSSARRLDVATMGRQRFEDRKIRIRAGDPKLRADLHQLKKVVGPTGAPRLIAEDGESHADRAWAIFLACAAAGESRTPAILDYYKNLTEKREAAKAVAS